MESTFAGLNFSETAWTLIRRAQNPDSAGYEEAINRLFQIYWRPIYGAIRWGWHCTREEAEDAAQEYLATFFEKGLLQSVREGEGRFRSFVKVTLKNFMLMRKRAGQAEKRGGNRKPIPLDVVEIEASAATGSPDEIFDREWMRAVFEESSKSLSERYRKAGREHAFELFRRYYFGEPTTYEALSADTGASLSEIKNLLHQARQDYREIVIDFLRDGVTDPDQLEEEVREIFGL